MAKPVIFTIDDDPSVLNSVERDLRGRYCKSRQEFRKSGIRESMKAPLYVRNLTKKERQAMQAGVRSRDPYVIRRSQIVMASERGQKAIEIAKMLGCDDQTVRNVIKGFNENGISILKEGSRRPHKTQAAFSTKGVEQLKEILHQSPRNFGKATSLWTLDLAAEVSYENKLVKEQVSGETIRATLKRFGMKWTRAKHWITSPDPDYELKKTKSALDKDSRNSGRLGIFVSRRDLVESFFPSRFA